MFDDTRGSQVGNGELAPTFTGGVQLDGNSQSGVGTFVGAGKTTCEHIALPPSSHIGIVILGINNGDPNSISPGVQTGFGFSQGQNGQTQVGIHQPSIP